MSACGTCSASSPARSAAAAGQQRRGKVWQVAPRSPCGVRPPTFDEQSPAPARRLSIRTRAASTPAPAELAVYNFSRRRAGTTAEWFQQAARELVKNLESAGSPMLQTVDLPEGGGSPRFNTYSVHESVVSVPQLWQGIAEHLSSHSPDVVILVQRVSPSAAAGSPQGAIDVVQNNVASSQAAAGDVFSSSSSDSSSSSSSSSSSPPGSPRSPTSHEMRVQAEEACRRLVASGLADSILQGQVGDCCDGSGGHHHTHDDGAAPSAAASSTAVEQRQPPPRPLPLPAIVPFSPSTAAQAARRSTVRAAALRPAGSPASTAAAGCQQSACYWGVVVQSRRHTGAEGCYLLKTVKNVSSTGCSCTHFSLTRISQGEHLEQQFVQSWLL